MNIVQNKTAGIKVKRVGMVIRLRPGCMDEYLKLHADSNPGVRDLLTKYHLENFSIFLHQIGNGNSPASGRLFWVRIYPPTRNPIFVPGLFCRVK